MRALRGDLWVMIGTETSVRNSVLKIAIVEDSPLIVSRVQSLLNEIDGVELIGEASSYDLALELMERIVPDVMILDISLKNSEGKNGITLLNMLKKTHPRVVVIMLTNLSDWYYRSQCATGGADFFFDKSNDFEKIPDALANIAKRRTLL